MLHCVVHWHDIDYRIQSGMIFRTNSKKIHSIEPGLSKFMQDVCQRVSRMCCIYLPRSAQQCTTLEFLHPLELSAQESLLLVDEERHVSDAYSQAADEGALCWLFFYV